MAKTSDNKLRQNRFTSKTRELSAQNVFAPKMWMRKSEQKTISEKKNRPTLARRAANNFKTIMDIMYRHKYSNGNVEQKTSLSSVHREKKTQNEWENATETKEKKVCVTNDVDGKVDGEMRGKRDETKTKIKENAVGKVELDWN